MKFGLTDEIIAGIEKVFETNSKVDKAFIFGSRAKGNFREGSDIDIAIKGQELSFKDIVSLSGKLEDLDIQYKIDLIDYTSIKEPALQEHIDRVGIEFYSRWKEYKLGDIAEITSSKRIFFSDYVTSGIPFYRSKEIIEKALGDNISTDLFIPIEKFKEIKEKFGAPVNGDILISAVGERAGIPYCVNNDGDFYFKDGNLIWFRNFNSAISSNFLVYYFNSSIGQQRLESTMIGSAQKALTIIGLKNLEVAFPLYSEQTAIASILSSLDDKIDLLQRQNKTLEQLAETLFRQWFVEEAEEYEMGCLGDAILIFDNLRVPVSSMERDKMKFGKLYPYYGAAKIMDYINDYIFDGEYILMGEDGTVQTEDGFPILQMPTGKFWVNNHTHVLQAKKPYSNYLIYIFLKQTNINHIVTGAVQPKINQENLKSLDFPILPDEKIVDFVNNTTDYWEKIKSNQTQIRTLTQTRDTLLPKLMSGEVRVVMDQ